VPDPIYDAYSGPIKLWKGQPSPVSSPRLGGRYTIDSGALARACKRDDRVLLLNTPWNPVGTVFTREELQDIMQFSEDHDIVVLSDEIYEGLVYGGRRHVSPASVADDARNRTVVINSLSKSYAMTGWRVGYCAGPERVIRAMLLVLQQSSRGPATFVQDAAVCALTGDQGCIERMRAEYQARRDVVLERLQGIPGVKPLKPEGGLFVMVDVSGLGISSYELHLRLLVEFGVVVVHGSAYGPGGEGTLRVSFAAGGETLERGLERLRAGLTQLAQCLR
jgi:aspartate/methionine/tyrosine aminotransferase